MALVPTKRLGPCLGENNRLPRHALSIPKEGDFIVSGENVDIDVTGRISRANGATLHQGLTAGHSLFSDGTRTLLADGTSLRRVTTFAPFASTEIDTVAGPVCYAEQNGEIFYSDGVKLRAIEAANTVRKVGIPVPSSLSASVIAGSLLPAKYQVTITYFYGDEEGGAYPSLNPELTVTGGIRLTMPTTPDGVTKIGAYISGPNGEVPLRFGTYGPSTTTIDLTSEPLGRACPTQLMGPMPAGNHLAFCLGRLISAKDNVLVYSEQYNFGLTNPSKNYLMFPEPITNVIDCKDGIYVTAGETWWITNFADPLGDPVLPYGAVARSASRIPNENKVFWLSERGVVVGDSLGQVKNLQEQALLLKLSGAGASLFVEGNNRIVATCNG